MFNVRSAWHRAKRRAAAQFLITAFQGGVHSEAALVTILLSQIEMLSSPFSNDDLDRWENEGGGKAFGRSATTKQSIDRIEHQFSRQGSAPG
ncbi:MULTISPECIES: hypothetical protein [Ensifer]|jgi:hypothetical protein|uniref:Uncharacterized protein n=1 Tax=Ensifer canadensis TaxID=555315 RepID=A0AAW4FXR5_9HYPH|nr:MULTISPECIES: hypothetical protein [Ensifer]KQU81837.1 hypothetical protein ASD00_34695 [Ensifer sp. Root31]KQW46847.1 hypothetical protein ASD02_34880 [Ensifer sp. Root1252]KQY69515.1 hypothetical protein ASD52_32310 [Ensifer sp. Root142]KRC69403.1 hypothetical protein ASE32_34705 [Ensifer sp. Root231]KRC96678.1 hypothetical protein ASE47_30970 [Ensifer sp. Root258]